MLKQKKKIGPYGEVPIPLLYLTNEEQEIVNTIEVDLKSYVEQLEARFITGVELYQTGINMWIPLKV